METNPFITSTVTCDPGDTALSGSFRIFGSAEIRFFEPLVTENGWNATALVTGNAGGGGNSGQVLADVVCFDNAPPHTVLDFPFFIFYQREISFFYNQ